MKRCHHVCGGRVVDAKAGFDRLVCESYGDVGLADSRRDSERLQHLRTILPTDVRVTSETHPLFGRLLTAQGFIRLEGVLHLKVTLPDGVSGTIPAETTNVFGEVIRDGHQTVLTVEGLRNLHGLVHSHRIRQLGDRRK